MSPDTRVNIYRCGDCGEPVLSTTATPPYEAFGKLTHGNTNCEIGAFSSLQRRNTGLVSKGQIDLDPQVMNILIQSGHLTVVPGEKFEDSVYLVSEELMQDIDSLLGK